MLESLTYYQQNSTAAKTGMFQKDHQGYNFPKRVFQT